LQELHGVGNGGGFLAPPPRAVDVKMDLLSLVLVLEVEQFHDDFDGTGVVDDARQEDDAVFQQQVSERHLPLAGVVAVPLEHRFGRKSGVQVKHGSMSLGLTAGETPRFHRLMNAPYFWLPVHFHYGTEVNWMAGGPSPPLAQSTDFQFPLTPWAPSLRARRFLRQRLFLPRRPFLRPAAPPSGRAFRPERLALRPCRRRSLAACRSAGLRTRRYPGSGRGPCVRRVRWPAPPAGPPSPTGPAGRAAPPCPD